MKNIMKNIMKNKKLSDMPVVVLDVETTGLHPRFGDRVVEIAAIRFEGDREVDRFTKLLYPERAMYPGATAVNGITDKMLADRPVFAEIEKRLTDFIGNALLVAHNAAFDASFVGMEYYIAKAVQRLTPSPWLCTLTLAREVFDFRRNDLTSLSEELGIDHGEAHHALTDALITADLLKSMARKLKADGWDGDIGFLFNMQHGEIHTTEPTRAYMLPESIAQAIKKNRRLKIVYVGANGQGSERVIRVAYPSENKGVIYLIADCELRGDRRTFRLDRIVEAETV